MTTMTLWGVHLVRIPRWNHLRSGRYSSSVAPLVFDDYCCHVSFPRGSSTSNAGHVPWSSSLAQPNLYLGSLSHQQVFEPSPSNHGDAVPVAADGIVPASFLSRGARLYQHHQKNPRFLLLVGASCNGVVARILPLPIDVSLPAADSSLRHCCAVKSFVTFTNDSSSSSS